MVQLFFQPRFFFLFEGCISLSLHTSLVRMEDGVMKPCGACCQQVWSVRLLSGVPCSSGPNLKRHIATVTHTLGGLGEGWMGSGSSSFTSAKCFLLIFLIYFACRGRSVLAECVKAGMVRDTSCTLCGPVCVARFHQDDILMLCVSEHAALNKIFFRSSWLPTTRSAGPRPQPLYEEQHMDG